MYLLNYYCLFLSIILLSACVEQSQVKNIKDLEPIETIDPIVVSLDFFNEDLEKQGRGCIVYSTKNIEEMISVEINNKIIEQLKNLPLEKYKLIFIAEEQNIKQQILAGKLIKKYKEKLSIYRDYKEKNGMIRPPYQNICKDLVTLYVTKNNVTIISRYKHKDEGISTILYLCLFDLCD